jgi:hypothetical protein
MNKRNQIYAQWKNRWIKEGMPWKSISIKAPEGWNPIEQLKNISNL